MCGSAIVMAVVKGQITNVVAGVLTGYLTVTAVTTFRPRSRAVRSLDVGLTLHGPAILDQFDCTSVIYEEQTARVDEYKNLIVT